ncbi:MAG: 16S rRNA (cytosine(1402)-N(4))-methyltransferase RsmH [Burkholderiales bacterium]|nr:16S rRNA (cytosine(1402)-N(4))-methyltransferase RsmH [Burkholderiales bacterium]
MPQDAPAHRPVLLAEAIEALAIDPAGVYLDLTFGRGGHSREILARLGPAGRLIALDRDPAAVAAARALEDARFSIHRARFSALERVLDASGVERVHGVLADLGVSSPQLEDPARGFSFRADGPLDMRMDPDEGPTAAQWLAEASQRQIREAIARYGEERFAEQIAKAIVAARARAPIERTGQLAAIVARAVGARKAGKDPATRTFQALRILVNRELEEVAMMLPAALARLAPGGRLAVISFHSLEDRIVKRVLAAAAATALPRDLPLTAREMPQPAVRLLGRARRPSAAEVAANPRARSARLRAAERTDAPLDRARLEDIGRRAWQS